MFNIKRALTATALTTALAGGIFGLGASTAEAAVTGHSGAPCAMVKAGGGIDFVFGTWKRSVNIAYSHGQYTLKKKRQCARVVKKYWP